MTRLALPDLDYGQTGCGLAELRAVAALESTAPDDAPLVLFRENPVLDSDVESWPCGHFAPFNDQAWLASADGDPVCPKCLPAMVRRGAVRLDQASLELAVEELESTTEWEHGLATDEPAVSVLVVRLAPADLGCGDLEVLEVDGLDVGGVGEAVSALDFDRLADGGYGAGVLAACLERFAVAQGEDHVEGLRSRFHRPTLNPRGIGMQA